MSDYSDHWYRSDDGLQLYARDYPADAGERPVLLCMHGLTRNAADFGGLAANLGGDYRVVVADQRGRGRSDRDPRPARYTPAVYVQDMFRLLDSLDVDRAILVGTSMGGLMAFLMAAAQPERVRALVINDIGPEVDPAGLARIRSYVGKSGPVRDWAQAVAQTRSINQAAFPDFSEQQWLAFTRGLYREEEGIPVLAYDPAIAQALDGEEPAVPSDLWPLMEAIVGIPMLLLRGEHSDILAPACVARMRQCNPQMSFTEVAGRGHAPTLDEESARRAIDTFLSGL